MWSDPDEARSDFVLAAAAAIFGGYLVGPLDAVVPAGVVHDVLVIVAVFATTGLVPLLLARHRREGVAAFGLNAPVQRVVPGLLLALPVIAVVVLQVFVASRALASALGGTNPDIPVRSVGLLDVVGIVVYAVGFALLFLFLTVKARDGFRPVEMKLLAALRTFGMGAAAAFLVCGALLAVTGRVSLAHAALLALALALTIAGADRMVDQRTTTPRVAVLAPAIVSLVITMRPLRLASLIPLLYVALVQATIVLVAAVLAQTRTSAWAGFGLLLAFSSVSYGAYTLVDALGG
jgi:hypothetical protein